MRRVRITIANIERGPSMHDQKWRDNTAAHYKRLQTELALREPMKYRAE